MSLEVSDYIRALKSDFKSIQEHFSETPSPSKFVNLTSGHPLLTDPRSDLRFKDSLADEHLLETNSIHNRIEIMQG